MEICRNCGAVLSPNIDWCGLCYTPVDGTSEKHVIVIPDVDTDAERTSPDLWTKVLYSALVVAVFIAATVGLWSLTDEVGSAAWAVTVFFLTTVGALGVVALIVAWMPRPPAGREIVVVVEEAPVVAPPPVRASGLPEPPERVEPSERIHPSIPRGSAAPTA